jgi:hypothetical protein
MVVTCRLEWPDAHGRGTGSLARRFCAGGALSAGEVPRLAGRQGRGGVVNSVPGEECRAEDSGVVVSHHAVRLPDDLTLGAGAPRAGRAGKIGCRS